MRWRAKTASKVVTHILSLTPFRRIVKDYYMICESYYEAIRISTPSQIEAIDMGRRGPSQRRLADADGPAGRQDRHRFRHGAPAVHAGLRPALARLSLSVRQIPRSMLFMCGMNAVRSPMAERLARELLPASTFVASAGVRAGERDPFVDAVLAEDGLSLGRTRPEDARRSRRPLFRPDRHAGAGGASRGAGAHPLLAVDVEYWPTADPTSARGTREQIMAAYRDVRDRLKAAIEARFGSETA